MNISRLKLKIPIFDSVWNAVMGYLNITTQLGVLTIIISKTEYLKVITAYLNIIIELSILMGITLHSPG